MFGCLRGASAVVSVFHRCVEANMVLLILFYPSFVERAMEGSPHVVCFPVGAREYAFLGARCFRRAWYRVVLSTMLKEGDGVGGRGRK